MFLVYGITGKVGAATARALLARGAPVRALVRNPAKAASWPAQDVEVVRGDLRTPSVIAAALRGVAGAFVMLPPVPAPEPGFPEAGAIIAALREALERAPPPRLVALSSVGSEREYGFGLITTTSRLEVALRDVTVPTGVVRAGSFLENYLPALEAASRTGVFESFLAPVARPTPHVATADIGEAVAALLTEAWSGRRTLELGSRFSPDDIARAMGAVLGRDVEARTIPRVRWPARLEAMGLPRGGTAALEEMQDAFNAGWIDFGASGTEAVPATTPPTDVFAEAWRGQNGTHLASRERP